MIVVVHELSTEKQQKLYPSTITTHYGVSTQLTKMLTITGLQRLYVLMLDSIHFFTSGIQYYKVRAVFRYSMVFKQANCMRKIA